MGRHPDGRGRHLGDAAAGTMPGQPDIPLLKESVRDLCRMTMQKTAGQRKDRRGDIPFDNLDRLKWTILMEACLLVLSGKLDALEGGAESETV